MSETTTDANTQTTILVEFTPRPGLRQVSLSREDVAQKSAQALDKALSTIREMGQRVTDTIKSINVADRPSKVELEFGLKFDAELGAVVAKASAEAGFKVVLTWEQDKENA
jgi:hypothetical protein